MGEPSQYELDAWRDIEQFQGRVLSRGMATMSSVVGQGAGKIGAGAAKFTDLAKTKVEWTPGAKAALERARGLSARSADLAGKAARHAGEALPDWTGPAGSSMKGALSKASRVGLSPDGVVKKHQKAGHDVARLADVRRLDLEDVDSVRGRGASWYYPAMAAATGAGAGFAITGGSLTVVASAGASAAPSAAAVFGAYAADGAAVLALSSRAVGQIALSYGYDPELPAEKLFVLAVVNAGTAVTASAKHAAFADISKLTQALVRGKTWTVLNESIVARVASKFAGDFTGRLTKQGWGRLSPASVSPSVPPSTGRPWRASSMPPTRRTGAGSCWRRTPTWQPTMLPSPCRCAMTRTSMTSRSASSTASCSRVWSCRTARPMGMTDLPAT